MLLSPHHYEHSQKMSSSVSYSIDDKDLDDAALWAVIDSAEASHSSTKSRKPLALKYTTTPSPPQNNPQTRRFQSPSSAPHNRPHKIARHCASETNESGSPLAVLRTPVATATTVSFSSPEAYLSPQIRTEVSLDGYARSENKDVMRHCLNAKFPSVSLFKDYQNAAMAILEKSDYTMISGSPFIKKSGWRKISFYFNVSYEIKDKSIEFDENRNVQRAEFVVRAYMQNGRFSDGWGSCERREKRFLKPNHDIPSTAETRAKNKACQDLLGIGEYRPGASQCRQ